MKSSHLLALGVVGIGAWYLWPKSNAAATKATTYTDAAGNPIAAGPQTLAQATADAQTTYTDPSGAPQPAGPQLQANGATASTNDGSQYSTDRYTDIPGIQGGDNLNGASQYG